MPKLIHTIEDFSTGTLSYPRELSKIRGEGLICGKNNVRRGGLWWKNTVMFPSIPSADRSFAKGGLFEWNSPINLLPDAYGDIGQEIDKTYLVFTVNGADLAILEKGNVDNAVEQNIAGISYDWPGVTVDNDLLHNTHFTSLDNVLYFSSNTESESPTTVPHYFQYFRQRGVWMGAADDHIAWMNDNGNFNTAHPYWGIRRGPASAALPAAYSIEVEDNLVDDPILTRIMLRKGGDSGVIASLEFDKTNAGGDDLFDEDHVGQYGYSVTYDSGESNIVFNEDTNEFLTQLARVRIFPWGINK